VSVGQQQAPRRGGQQPLPGNTEGGKSPVVAARLPRPQHDRLAELAAAAGGTVSDLIRELVGRELERADAGES